jgi:Transglycosylase SLT domain
MSYPRKQSPEQWATQLNFAGLERKHGLPAGVLVNLVRQESGGDSQILGPVTSNGERAVGLCQFMPRTAAWRNVDANCPVSSINGAAKHLEYLMDYFKGDPEKAIAAYNWGEGNLGKLLNRHPNDWKNYLPNETKHYLAVVSKGIGRSFVQRQQAHEAISDEDVKTEEQRRRTQLRAVGLPTLAESMDSGNVLSDLFFGLFKFFADIAEKLFSDKPLLDQSAEARAPLPSVAQRRETSLAH